MPPAVGGVIVVRVLSAYMLTICSWTEDIDSLSGHLSVT